MVDAGDGLNAKADGPADFVSNGLTKAIERAMDDLAPTGLGEGFVVDGVGRLISSVVAYMDELGARSRIMGMNDDDLNSWRSAIADGLRWFDTSFQAEAVITFSDNTAVAYPIRGPKMLTDVSDAVGQLVAGVGGLQATALLQFGRWHRGGIALGRVFAEPGFIIGPGLVEAVQLEGDYACHPRILLSEACLVLLAAGEVLTGGPPMKGFVLVDSDDRCFIDYLQIALQFDLDEEADGRSLRLHRDLVLAELGEGHPERVHAKYEWAARYHNHVCREVESDLLIDIADAPETALGSHFQAPMAVIDRMMG